MSQNLDGYSLVIPVHPPHFGYVGTLIRHAALWEPPPNEIIIAASEYESRSSGKWPARWGDAAAWCPKIRISSTSEVASAGLNRNRGWSEATEPWVSFVDADDIYRPERMGILFDAAIRYQAAAVVNSFSYLQSPRRFLRKAISFDGLRDVLTSELRAQNFPGGLRNFESEYGDSGQANLVIPNGGPIPHQGHLLIRTNLREDFGYGDEAVGEDGILLRDLVFAGIPLAVIRPRLSLYKPWRWKVPIRLMLRQVYWRWL